MNKKKRDKLIYKRIKRNIKKFNGIDLDNISENELKYLIENIILFDRSFELFNEGQYPNTTKYFRTRKVKADQLNSINDFWEAPKCYTELNRLNKKGESILYLSPNLPDSPILESKMDYNDRFILIEYETIKPIVFTYLGTRHVSPMLNKMEFKIDKKVSKFISKWLTSSGNDSVYKVTNIIKTIQQEISDQNILRKNYLYDSVIDRKFYNIALQPEYARKNLAISKIYYCANIFGYYGIGSTLYVLAEIELKNEKPFFIRRESPFEVIIPKEVTLNVEELKYEIERYIKHIDQEKINNEIDEIIKLNNK